MHAASLLSLSTVVPTHAYLQKDILAAAWEHFGPRFPEFEKLATIFANTGIAKRHSVKPFYWYLERQGWPERTAAFLEGAEALFADAAEKALAAAQLKAVPKASEHPGKGTDRRSETGVAPTILRWPRPSPSTWGPP